MSLATKILKQVDQPLEPKVSTVEKPKESPECKDGVCTLKWHPKRPAKASEILDLVDEIWPFSKKDDSEESRIPTKDTFIDDVEDTGRQFYSALDQAASGFQPTNSKVATLFRTTANAVNHFLKNADAVRNKMTNTSTPYYLKHRG